MSSLAERLLLNQFKKYSLFKNTCLNCKPYDASNSETAGQLHISSGIALITLKRHRTLDRPFKSFETFFKLGTVSHQVPVVIITKVFYRLTPSTYTISAIARYHLRVPF